MYVIYFCLRGMLNSCRKMVLSITLDEYEAVKKILTEKNGICYYFRLVNFITIPQEYKIMLGKYQ